MRSVLFTLLLLPALATAQPAPSELEKAMTAFEAGDFATARTHLRAAYDADPQPDLLYALGQVEQKLDNCTAAIAHYNDYLATKPPKGAAKDTREAIKVCEEKLATQPPKPAGPYTPPQPVFSTEKVADTPRGPSRWYADPLGLGLIGGGIIVGAIGVVVYTDARSDLDAAEVAVDHAAYEDLVDTAEGKRSASTVLIGGSIALIAGGVVRLALRDRGGERANVALVPTSGGSIVTWGGSF